MLRPRLIPCLLLKDGGLVKTVGFKDAKYVGDPLNAVRIFNEKEADELMVLDIDATTRASQIDFARIGILASECRMPLCYGGGIADVDDALRIIGLGVEKVAISASALRDQGLITRLADAVGSQSVVIVLDVRRRLLGRGYDAYIKNGSEKVRLDVFDFIGRLGGLGAGEIVINSIDRDGAMRGYDLDLVSQVRERTSLPLTALGGAGSYADISDLIRRFGIIGAAAGSLFVFKGKYRAVLITYPRPEEKDRVLSQTGAAPRRGDS